MPIDVIKSAVQKLDAPVPSIPQKHSVRVSNGELEENIEGDLLADGLSSGYFFVYEDASGEISERRVSVRGVHKKQDGSLLISAYCFERKALRSFRIDRLEEIVDLATGEVIDDPEEIENLFLSHATASGSLDALKKCKHGLNVLVYLARCDGRFRAEEVDVIVNYIMDKCFDYDFSDGLLEKRIKGLYPDIDHFSNSLDYFKRREADEFKNIARYAARLVQADGLLVSAEVDFIQELTLLTH